MLQDTAIIPGVVNTIEFSGPHGFARFLDAEAQHVLLNMRLSIPERRIFLNTRNDGVWGEPDFLDLAGQEETDRVVVHLKLTDVLELWTSTMAMRFERFDAETAGNVRYCMLRNATNPGGTLKLSVPRPEEMAAQIASQVVLRRLDQIERQLPGLAGEMPADR